MISLENFINSSLSCKFGLPVANLCTIKCSVTEAIAAMEKNPNVINVSFNSNNISSYALLPYVATKIAFEPFPFSFS
ncbi:hypothetical protein [Terrisporobacter petrolearius]|uniref:hypothetical protein n=1 Tax=Terrisporobacter petrolearius TaxID=1460447 RepID=UPI001D16B574|nr:hypothetical protein [Terrisporobacter petrolearius]